MVKQERLLIISNNVLSTTRNNGKTILSCIDTLPKNQVRQLYFSEEIPTLADYKYYQISDTDIINARLKREKPGRAIARLNAGNSIKESIEKKNLVRKTLNAILSPCFYVMQCGETNGSLLIYLNGLMILNLLLYFLWQAMVFLHTIFVNILRINIIQGYVYM